MANLPTRIMSDYKVGDTIVYITTPFMFGHHGKVTAIGRKYLTTTHFLTGKTVKVRPNDVDPA